MKKWIIAAILLGLLASCKSKALPNEDFNSLSPDELEVVREMRRGEILRKDAKKRKRKLFWRTNTGSPYYNTYDSYYRQSQERKIRNKILYPNLYGN